MNEIKIKKKDKIVWSSFPRGKIPGHVSTEVYRNKRGFVNSGVHYIDFISLWQKIKYMQKGS